MAVEPQIINFWICWRLDTGMVRFKHPTLESAITEAKRISNIEKTPVHVLECVGAAVGDLYFPVDPNV